MPNLHWEYKKTPKNSKEIIQVCIWKEFTYLMIPFLAAGKKFLLCLKAT